AQALPARRLHLRRLRLGFERPRVPLLAQDRLRRFAEIPAQPSQLWPRQAGVHRAAVQARYFRAAHAAGSSRRRARPDAVRVLACCDRHPDFGAEDGAPVDAPRARDGGLERVRRSSFCQAAVLLLALMARAHPARATLPQEGQPILTNDYRIDMYQGLVLSANRVIGLGGAFVAIADGVEGSAMNPAAASARTPY